MNWARVAVSVAIILVGIYVALYIDRDYGMLIVITMVVVAQDRL